MIPRSLRLHRNADILHTFKKARRSRTTLFLFYQLPSREPEHRIAIVISRVVHKSAVKRNLLKRRTAAAIQQSLKKHSSLQKYDLIFYFRKDVEFEKFSFALIQQEVSYLLGKIFKK